ncbi:phytoene desaturase family protein [Sulfobacillus harzensis]|uniref:Pyridine nucleotide-disulfide oxidoreductase domain-containing protein 2 n=1 Tax=Sulfobacillus harzensis TaxID=2729629 RepID=A0A7Y0Q3A0_9FIRM|nr:NAD(P)/FAD-dependent oxidoreductase [Sulfobacillus harzensis]NMP22756.1 NAD(P)/FAD-dependent oxidoreductase [Sulfobacillus harzensis]
MHDADIVIVGAGHNGLAAGIVLARAGLKVIIVESRDTAGGAAKSGALTRPGFIHDFYASNVGLFLGSALYREFGDEIRAAGFQTDVADQPYGNVFPDGRALPIYTNAEATDEAIRAFSSADVSAWHDLIREFQEASPYLFPLLQMPIPSWAFGKTLFRLGRRLGWARAQELGALLLQSPREFVDSRFTSPEMKALLIPWGYHLDFNPDASGGATFPFLESMVDFANGMAITHGGIGRLVDALVSVFERHGGKLLLGRTVEQVVVRGGRAVGVQTTDGQELSARRAVLANVTPAVLFGRLVREDAVPSTFYQRIRRFRYGPGTMMVHLALDGPVPWRSPTMGRSLYVHVAPYVDDVAEADYESRMGLLPRSPMLVIGQQSVWDSSRAPKGYHTLWVQVRSVPGNPRDDAARKIDITRGWDGFKEEYADRVMEKIELYAPGLRDRVVSRAVLSPIDLERDNANLVGGDSVSGSHHLDQFYLFRPVPGWSRYRTPVAGLWMAGAFTWPGGGLNATSGYLAAKEILKGRQ